MEFEYSKTELDNLFLALYNGDIDPLALPEDLYLAIGKYILFGMNEGFGAVESAADKTLIAELQENVYLFSAAKTFQQTLEMSDALVNSKGELVPFDEFKTLANEIFVRYNGGDIDGVVKSGWIEAEYNTSIAQAGNAQKWNQIQSTKETLPYLIYSATNSACDICAPLDGICLPVDDPFWSKYMPENHFNCNCVVEQADKEEGESKESTDEDLSAAELNKVPDEFKFNAGKQQEIFSTEGKSQHPYFTVSKEYTKFAERNFDLEIIRRGDRE